HGLHGDIFDVAQNTELNEAELKTQLQKMYPDMKNQVLNDLLPLVVGNQEHVAELLENPRPLADANHKEQVLGIGRGFDWLHQHNKAQLIGPFGYTLADAITKA